MQGAVVGCVSLKKSCHDGKKAARKLLALNDLPFWQIERSVKRLTGRWCFCLLQHISLRPESWHRPGSSSFFRLLKLSPGLQNVRMSSEKGRSWAKNTNKRKLNRKPKDFTNHRNLATCADQPPETCWRLAKLNLWGIFKVFFPLLVDLSSGVLDFSVSPSAAFSSPLSHALSYSLSLLLTLTNTLTNTLSRTHCLTFRHSHTSPLSLTRAHTHTPSHICHTPSHPLSLTLTHLLSHALSHSLSRTLRFWCWTLHPSVARPLFLCVLQ